MYVGVIHRISDPEAFERAEREAVEAGLPEGVGLPVHAVTPDHSMAICIWEAPSVDAVRDLVESAVGPYSENEYYEVNLQSADV